MVTRLMRFSIAGVVGFAAQVAALGLLMWLTPVHYAVATALAVEAAIALNFVLHERWTWKDRTGYGGAQGAQSARSAIGRFVRFNALTGATSLLGGVIVTAVFVESFGMHAIAANVLSVVLLGAVNFVGADMLVFRAAAIVLMTVAAAGPGFASTDALEAKLQPRTLQGFRQYVAAVEARRNRELAENLPFMDLDRRPAAERARILATLKRGEVFVERGAVARNQAAEELSVEGGLINHWRGTVLVPNVTLDQVLKVLQEPQTDKHKQEDVISSRVISRDGDSQKVFLRLRRTKFVTVVYDTEYDVDYRRLAPDRALSNSISTRIVEIENAGTPRERALPEGNDHGYMWRLNSYWRYRQVDGGVLVEVESLTLSRDLPALIGALIRPIVNSTARESMTRTLASVRARFS